MTVTHYLHKTSIGVVNTIDTQGYAFNTTEDWSGATQERSQAVTAGSYVNWYFYLYPVLAGTLVHSGTPTVAVYFKSNASVSDIDFVTTINKVSSTGTKTQLSTKTSSSQSVGTGYATLTNTHASLSASVLSGFNLELNITLGGSASNLTLYMAYDTATYKSKLTFSVNDPLAVSLSSDKNAYEWEDTATLTASVTDIWGGYDIDSTPTISWTLPSGLSSSVTTALSTGDAQYTNTYTYSSTLGGKAGKGTWQSYLANWASTSSVSDKSGNSYTSSSITYELRPSGGSIGDGDGGATPLPAIDTRQVQSIIGIIVIAALILIYAVKSRKKR